MENFRLFEKLEMDFHPQVTVLIGENGAGKTALVEGIAKMLMPIPELLENPYKHDTVFQKDSFNYLDIRFGEDSTKNKIEVVFSNSSEDSSCIWEGSISRNNRYFHQFSGDGFGKLIGLSGKISTKERKGEGDFYLPA
ncbi:MAG: ATP-binding protein, partial [Saprospiraceae bacterium]|nr:ATP-binding protein [Saprospiraceae bacterium]